MRHKEEKQMNKKQYRHSTIHRQKAAYWLALMNNIKPPLKTQDVVQSEWKVKYNKPKSNFCEIIWYSLQTEWQLTT